MIDEVAARLLLFSAIKPGDIFWANQIASLGALQVYQKIIKDSNYRRISDYQAVKERVSTSNPSDLITQIKKADSEFISPKDFDWPISLMDLAAPPIGLVIKGNRKLLANLDRSISIVGSRRPTTYGLAVAKKLAEDCVTAKLAVISGGATELILRHMKAQLKSKVTVLPYWLVALIIYIHPRTNHFFLRLARMVY